MNEIVYIAGAGRSGSTILDIVLGSSPSVFGAGELINLRRVFSTHEKCSCGARVIDCEFWSPVYESWISAIEGSILEYEIFRKKYVSNRNLFKLFVVRLFRKKEYSRFISNTLLLYQIISSCSDCNVIVDSSKSPVNIVILRDLKVDLKIIHLKRKFSSVLNSNKKRIPEDLGSGIERDQRPKRTLYVFLNWIYYNMLSKLLTIGCQRIKIRYEELAPNLVQEVSKVVTVTDKYRLILENGGPFKPYHTIAGNRVRMKKEICVREVLNSHPFLTKFQRSISAIIDKVF